MSSLADGRGPAGYPAYPEPEARPPRAPLTKRMRPGHWIALDCVAGAFVALCDTAEAARHLEPGPVRLPAVLLVLVGVFLPVAFRRRAPVLAFGALLILGVAVAHLSLVVSASVFLASVFALYTVTVQTRKRTGVAALGLLLATMLGVGIAGPHAVDPRAAAVQGTDAGVFIPVALGGVIAWMTGYSVRQRRRYVVTLQQQAASSAVAEERLRIARELHDVVAHSMSVIAVQAGYGQYVIDNSPDGAREALGAIQATSRDALEEMRRMLGVLRQQEAAAGTAAGGTDANSGRTAIQGASDGTVSSPVSAATDDATGTVVTGAGGGGTSAIGAPLTPAPGLGALDRLVSRTRGAGVRVTLEVSGHARPAPAGVDLSAFRIIQEALTNVVKHAGTGAACVVSLAYTDADLVLRVTDDGGRAAWGGPATDMGGTGHGVIGMRERVNLCGGTFTAGPRPQGGFQVTAALPLPAITLPDAGAEDASLAHAPAALSLTSALTSALTDALTEGQGGRR